MPRSANPRLVRALLLALVATFGWSAAAHTRQWVKDELLLSVRKGAGTEFERVEVISTGDAVEVLGSAGRWVRVRTAAGVEGWIPDGYLVDQIPARLRLERYEANASDLQRGFDEASAELVTLRTKNFELGAADAGLRSRIVELSQENLELRAGARWPEWIAGSFILLVGALLGIWVHRSTARRPSSRLRL